MCSAFPLRSQWLLLTREAADAVLADMTKIANLSSRSSTLNEFRFRTVVKGKKKKRTWRYKTIFGWEIAPAISLSLSLSVCFCAKVNSFFGGGCNEMQDWHFLPYTIAATLKTRPYEAYFCIVALTHFLKSPQVLPKFFRQWRKHFLQHFTLIYSQVVWFWPTGLGLLNV